MMRLVNPVLLLLLIALPGHALAHEVRPAFLQIDDAGNGNIDIEWKAPLIGGRAISVEPLLPAHCDALGGRDRRMEETAVVETWRVSCVEPGLAGHEIRLAGLERTVVDVFVEVIMADGTRSSLLLKPERPSFVFGSDEIADAPGRGAWFQLGVEHLLLGFDHILFVVALVLLLRQPRELVKVITSFTVAHSLTLGLSALGGVSFHQGAVEAVIALSILVLAVELVKTEDHGRTLIFRYPWAITFVFGLLHGFGFAGALAEIGLPRDSAAMALLLFNIGVEVGQLIIVAMLLLLLAGWQWLSRQLPALDNPRLHVLPAQFIGVLASYWFIDRTLGVLF